ncbi:MAG TPA: hypothetical protein VJL54_00305 [Nitrososphaera sp.]|jgi:hypothetical protein|nr:hypothetical protein [Nitrososphaera sp.]
MQGQGQRVAELVDNLHELLEAKQAGADVAMVSLISTAGEIALSMIVARPDLKADYLKAFNSSVEQVRRQLRQELKSRGI